MLHGTRAHFATEPAKETFFVQSTLEEDKKTTDGRATVVAQCQMVFRFL